MSTGQSDGITRSMLCILFELCSSFQIVCAGSPVKKNLPNYDITTISHSLIGPGPNQRVTYRNMMILIMCEDHHYYHHKGDFFTTPFTIGKLLFFLTEKIEYKYITPYHLGHHDYISIMFLIFFVYFSIFIRTVLV